MRARVVSRRRGPERARRGRPDGAAPARRQVPARPRRRARRGRRRRAGSPLLRDARSCRDGSPAPWRGARLFSEGDRTRGADEDREDYSPSSDGREGKLAGWRGPTVFAGRIAAPTRGATWTFREGGRRSAGSAHGPVEYRRRGRPTKFEVRPTGGSFTGRRGRRRGRRARLDAAARGGGRDGRRRGARLARGGRGR